MSGCPAGYNPMEWDCQASGCFNRVKRPKIETFAECFPRNIAMADVDGTVEVNGRFLFIEWKTWDGKSPSAQLKYGQRLYWERLTKQLPGSIVYIVYGDAEAMVIHGWQWVCDGIYYRDEFPTGSLEEFKQVMREWVTWAERHPVPSL